MKSSTSESKPFQSRSRVEIPGQTRRKERLSRSKLKEPFLIDSDAELLGIRYLVWLMKRSASEPGLSYHILPAHPYSIQKMILENKSLF